MIRREPPTRYQYIVLVLLGLMARPAVAQTDEWVQLFNGKDLSGWEQVGKGNFVVEDGMLKTVGGMGLLWYTRQKVEHSVVRVVFKLTHDQVVS